MMVDVLHLSLYTQVDCKRSQRPLHPVKLFISECRPAEHPSPEHSSISVYNEYVSLPAPAVSVNECPVPPARTVEAVYGDIVVNLNSGLFSFAKQPIHDTIHSALHVVIAVMHHLGVAQDGIHGRGVKRGGPEEE